MMDAVRQGIMLCGTSVIPALFPYMVMVNFVVGAGVMNCLPPGIQVFLLGALGGYPMGAKAAAALAQTGEIDREEAGRLSAVCNNASPAFCLMLVGKTVLHSLRAGVWLYASQLLAALLVSLLFRPEEPPRSLRPAPSRLPPVTLFVESVEKAALTMIQICGFVVFFQALLYVLSHFLHISQPFIWGLIELTNGVTALDAARRASFVAAGFLISWGGLCTAAQTAAVLRSADISPRGYLFKRLLCACLTALLCGLGCEWVM